MLNYRNAKRWKQLAANLMKGVVLIGTVAWLSVSLGTVPERQTQEAVVHAQMILPAVKPDAEKSDAVVPEESAGVTFSPESKEKAESETSDPTVACGEFYAPTQGVLTSGFGMRQGRRHTGIDIGGEDGAEIHAADGGCVVFAGWADGYGNYVVIDHKNGYQTAYGHCSALLVAEGEAVMQGQIIAYMGSTGNSTGPHLHFEIKENGEYRDPLDYVLY